MSMCYENCSRSERRQRFYGFVYVKFLFTLKMGGRVVKIVDKKITAVCMALYRRILTENDGSPKNENAKKRSEFPILCNTKTW